MGPVKIGTPKQSAANVASFVAKNGPGTVYLAAMSNGAGATNFLQVFDAASLPANGTIPMTVFNPSAAVSTTVGQDFSPSGMSFNVGCVVAKSTTAGTLTVGAADGILSAVVGEL